MKSWYKSKTVWFNILTVLVVVASFFGFTPNQELSEEVSGYLLVLSPLINLLLRFITTKGIVLK